ncbi:hypothetical protein Gorai_010335, partial [Gossypium raimondii]|nr:hypothetical protein [Gossypium raimondii]
PEPWKYLLNVLGFRAKWQSRFFSFNIYKNATADALPSPPLVKSSPKMLLNFLLGFSPMSSDECQPVIGMSGPDRGSQKEHTRLVSSIAYCSRREKATVPYLYYSTVNELTSGRKPGRSIGRGGLIDEKELVKFLVQGRVGRADLNVHEDEPHVPPEQWTILFWLIMRLFTPLNPLKHCKSWL